MAELDSLIRVRKNEVEHRQKALSRLYTQSEELKNQRDSLETQLAIESEKMKDVPPELLEFFAPYAKKTRTEIEMIDQARARLEKRIQLAQEEMREAFAELKKIEIIDERRRAEFLAEIEKRESALLDEIALQMFNRAGD